jgi:hypothetical protein
MKKSLCVLTAALLLSGLVFAQGRGRGGQPGSPAGAAELKKVIGQVRVTSVAANVHAAPTSAAIVLVNVPNGTVLNLLEQRGPWFAVQLTPELRKASTPLRWYRGETVGYMHSSTAEVIDAARPK